MRVLMAAWTARHSRLACAFVLVWVSLHAPQLAAQEAYDPSEKSIAELQADMAAGRVDSAELVQAYLRRVRDYDARGPRINAVIELNPDALSQAQSLDAERARSGPRGPLHGIPLMLKDNIDTADAMQTTAGSLALIGTRPSDDAHLVQRLRAAGAIILAKTNLSEWANFRSSRSASGWSARGGLTRNPYAVDRSACGSSSGSAAAVAASFAAVAVGTETDGSITCPAAMTGVVGVKPTLGLVSRDGIIPISALQDTAGPMARSVEDAALLLQALSGYDPADPTTAVLQQRTPPNFAASLDPEALRGARIGVARNLAGFHEQVDIVFEQALVALQAAGAVLVDPVELPVPAALGDDAFSALLHEFKDGLERYLASRPGGPQTLRDLIAFNRRYAPREMPYFGQELFVMAEASGPLSTAEHLQARANARRLAGPEGIDATLGRHQLDAIVAPTVGLAWTHDLINGDRYIGGGASTPAAVAGYPHVTVPAGYALGLPVGLSFLGSAWSDARLIGYAYAFEQRSAARRPPDLTATLPAP